MPLFLTDWPRWPFLFTFRPEKHKLGRGLWDLNLCQVSLYSVQRFQRKSQNMSQSIRGQRGHIVFSISPKNTNLVEDVENLLSVKFRWIPFSGFKEVENVSANKRQGWLSCFSDRPEKRRGKVENVSANQSPGWPSCFSDRPEKHKLGRRLWDLASCQILLNYFQRFQRRSQKCLSQSEARAAILFFQLARTTKIW